MLFRVHEFMNTKCRMNRKMESRGEERRGRKKYYRAVKGERRLMAVRITPTCRFVNVQRQMLKEEPKEMKNKHIKHRTLDFVLPHFT